MIHEHGAPTAIRCIGLLAIDFLQIKISRPSSTIFADTVLQCPTKR